MARGTASVGFEGLARNASVKTAPPVALPVTLKAAETAKAAYLAGVAAADPTKLVKAKVRTGALDDWLEDRERPRPIHVLALGKAAARMVWGLVEANVPFSGIGAAPAGAAMPQLDGFSWHRGEHPVPGPGSMAAGDALLSWCRRLPSDAHVLALLSGGGSAVAEAWRPGVDPDDAVAAWRTWLDAGIPVEQMNQHRARLSQIKGGGLAKAFTTGVAVRAWIISDATEPASVASGPLQHPAIPHEVLADAETAVAGAAQSLASAGLEPFAFPRRVTGLEDLDTFLSMAESLGPRAALVGGGEPVFPVPPGAPAGGRCQHVALAAAGWLHRHASDRVFLAGATDGVDGSTREAGAWAVRDDADPVAWARFDAHGALARRGRTFRTGHSGTNVNDLWISIHAGMM